jgi:hypothetical protein
MGVCFTDVPPQLRQLFGLSPTGTPLPGAGPFVR